jgi:GNAT superfamily N-acetyltransferase
MVNLIDIRIMTSKDVIEVVNSFAKCYAKPSSIFETYLAEQKKYERIIWLAYYDNIFAGYITLKYHAEHLEFAKQNIPVIMDLNVLPFLRNQGIGSALLKMAENEAFSRSKIIGLGVGLYEDYGKAQKLYVTRGYVPYGNSITYQNKKVEYGESVILDDDLVMWFTKKIDKNYILRNIND